MNTGGNMITWATNRLMTVLDHVGREWENARLRAERADLRRVLADAEAEVTRLREANARLEQALTDAHGTILDMQPDQFAVDGAADVAAELAAFRRELEGL